MQQQIYLHVELVFQVILLSNPRHLGLDALFRSESTKFQLHQQLHLAWRRQHVFHLHWQELFNVDEATSLQSAWKTHTPQELNNSEIFCFDLKKPNDSEKNFYTTLFTPLQIMPAIIDVHWTVPAVMHYNSSVAEH